VAVHRGWTPAEDEFVRRAYPKYPAPEIAKYLNRTTAAVYMRAKRLGVKKPDCKAHGKREMPRHVKEALGVYAIVNEEAQR